MGIHDLQESRRLRHAAVLHGMRFMHHFLLKDRCTALYSIGDDAAMVFFEIWSTSADTLLRANAKGIALDLLKRYHDWILREKPRKTTEEMRDVFMQLMYLSRCYAEI